MPRRGEEEQETTMLKSVSTLPVLERAVSPRVLGRGGIGGFRKTDRRRGQGCCASLTLSLCTPFVEALLDRAAAQVSWRR